MKHAHHVLDFMGGLMEEVKAQTAFRQQVQAEIGHLNDAIAGEPEAKPDASVLSAAAAVIQRLRQERDEARQQVTGVEKRCSCPGPIRGDSGQSECGWSEAVHNLRVLQGEESNGA